MRRVAVIFSLLIGFLSQAQNDAIFDKATALYNDGAYKEAIENYELILKNGEHSAALYYNLGNCYYKLNQIAPSIYNYEKALLLDPGDKEIKNNLAFARQMTIDAIEPLPVSGFAKIYNSVIGVLSFDQWAYLTIGFILLFVLGYLAYYFLKYSSQKRVAFVGSMVALILAALFLAFAFVQYRHYNAEQPAIVFASECLVKSEPNNRSTEVFLLHEGTKIQVIEGLEEYSKIELADGKTGWVLQEDIRLLKDF